ncbi:hypothetical protein V8C34DRAFT_327425 [Trichoderma compactum]
MREETSEPPISTPLEAHQLQLMRLEAQGETPWKMARQEQLEPGINLLQQDFELRWKLLEAQGEQSFEMTDQEQPKPATSLAQQDYELQLRHLEAQNKKRLQMARQEQSKLNIQPPQTQIQMKGPPEPNVMAVMGSTQANATAGSGNMMATLPPGARYFIPAPPANPVAMNVKNMPNSEVQPTTLPTPPNPPDPSVLILQRQLRVLQLKTKKPHWIKSGEKLQLKAYSPLLYPDAYILYKPLSFVIYKYYSPDLSTEAGEILQQGGQMPDPEPTREVIKLLSDDMIKAVKLFEKEDEEAQKKFPCLSVKKEMSAPYLWWYHYRDNLIKISNLPNPEAELIYLLTNWIDANYSELYNKIDSQFKPGVVSATSLPFLVQPGDVLVRWDAEGRNSEMQEPPEDPDWTLLSVPCSKKSEWSWEVDAWSYVYSGDFYRVMRKLDINLDVDTADREIPIVNLNISYDDPNKNDKHAREEHYMIDCRPYKIRYFESTPNQRATAEENALMNEFRVECRFAPGYQAPSEPEVYLFPRTIIGYHVQRKEWNHLNVDKIRGMPWNEHAFSNIATDVDIEELKKGNTFITVFHGGPGTGKTFTTESIAELAKNRLFPMRCSKTNVTAKHPETRFNMARLWGALLMFEDAELFSEQRSLDGMPPNTLVSNFLTRNRSAGDLDELLQSRSRLSVHYEAPTQPRRAQIWRNLLSHLGSLGDKNIGFDGIDAHMGKLAERVMDEHHICNAVTAAWQLAQFQGK